MTDLISCPWCNEQTDVGSLVGRRQSLCPCCGKTVLSAPFGAIKTGSHFLCDLGGKWEKTSVSDALCVEDDETYRVGEPATFTEDSPVYPFLISDLYPLGECPDCGDDIPDDAVDGTGCIHCGHVFAVSTQAEFIC